MHDTKDIKRKCIACNQIVERSKLIRVLKLYNAQDIVIQPDSKQFGRSAYICYNKECLKTALKKKRLERIFKKPINTDLIEKIEGLINQKVDRR